MTPDLMRRCVKGQAVKLGVAHPAYLNDAVILSRWESELGVTGIIEPVLDELARNNDETSVLAKR
jgi:hypothetical protein